MHAKDRKYYSHFTDEDAGAQKDYMSCPKGTAKWQKLTPKLVLLLLNLFTPLSEEATQQGAGKEDLTPKLLLGESYHYWENFPHLRPQTRAVLACPRGYHMKISILA